MTDRSAFAQLGLSEAVLRAVDKMGYENPTPVQEQAIPLVLAGNDVVAAAKTGTGKTAAFSLPLMDKLGHTKRKREPLMLVITPTRELANQIGEVCSTVAKSTKHRMLTVVGGVAYGPQTSALNRGVDILIATPGRLIDLMNQRAVDLSKVKALVLDEADRMLDMGFWPSVKKIVAATAKERQTLLFSATIDKAMLSSIDGILKSPKFVEIAQKGETADTIDQYVIPTTQTLKAGLLKALLDEKGGTKVIVFTRTRSRADSTTRRLKRAGYNVEAIHSDKTQAQRKRALENFSKGKTNFLVATDVLARGIDVPEVDYVVNYDLPNQPEDYVHRIGRTGRAGERGFSVSLVSPDQKAWLKDIEKLIKRKIPTMKLADYNEEAAEAEMARKATNHAARKDPELAAAAKEHQKRNKKKEKKTEEPKQFKKSDKSKSQYKKKKPSPSKVAPKPANKNNGAPTHSGGDLRPGRAQRAARARKRTRNR